MIDFIIKVGQTLGWPDWFYKKETTILSQISRHPTLFKTKLILNYFQINFCDHKFKIFEYWEEKKCQTKTVGANENTVFVLWLWYVLITYSLFNSTCLLNFFFHNSCYDNLMN